MRRIHNIIFSTIIHSLRRVQHGSYVHVNKVQVQFTFENYYVGRFI